MVQKSKEYKIDLNAKNQNSAFDDEQMGQTAFHLACEYGNLDVVKLLIQKSTEFNIKLNTKDDFGRTAFHWACIKGHLKIAKLLMRKSSEANIDLNAKDKYRQTAFHWACSKGQSKVRFSRFFNPKSWKLS